MLDGSRERRSPANREKMEDQTFGKKKEYDAKTLATSGYVQDRHEQEMVAWVYQQ